MLLVNVVLKPDWLQGCINSHPNQSENEGRVSKSDRMDFGVILGDILNIMLLLNIILCLSMALRLILHLLCFSINHISKQTQALFPSSSSLLLPTAPKQRQHWRPSASAAPREPQNRKILPRLSCRRSITVGRQIINNHRPAVTAHIDFVLGEDSIKSQRGDSAIGCSFPQTFKRKKKATWAAAGVAGYKMRENGGEDEGSTVCDEKHKQRRVLETPVGT